MYDPYIKNSIKDVKHQAANILKSSVFQELLKETPNIIMILNSHRQVVYLNRNPVPPSQYIEDHSQGLRAGECLGCLNAGKGELGCASSEFCKVCGFNAALKESENGKVSENECNISLKNGASLILSVYTKPFFYENETFIFCALEDISEKKRRQMLENIFLHDILNTAAVIQGLSDAYQEMPPDKAKLMLGEVAANITDEIQSYKLISNAETQTLQPNYTSVDAKALVNEAVQSLRSIQKFSKRQIDITCDIESLVTERTLLRRVLINMLKNALEAGSNKDNVKIFCRYNPESDLVEFSVKNPQHIPQSAQLKLFQKSFSTKGRGRGWGTYSIKILTEKYLNGFVNFSSYPGEGTVFTIRIPSMNQ